MSASQTPGERFRSDVEAEFEADVIGRTLLDMVVRTMEECAEMEAAIAVDGLTIDGARGQKVAHPLIRELKAHRALLVRLLDQLLPEEDGETPSQKAARAARRRWGR